MIPVLAHVAALLADEAAGVNALLASEPYTDRTIPSVDVLTVLDTPWLARALLDPAALEQLLDDALVERPLLAISFPPGPEGAFPLPMAATDAKGVQVPVLIRYLGRSDASDTLLSDAYVTLCTAARVLVVAGERSGGAANEKTTTRDGCVIGPPRGGAFLPVVQTLGDVLLAGGVHVVFNVKDRWIMGAQLDA